MMSGLRGEAPKIVQIETRYVQTDAVNFRDVVQSLTGKNSSTAWIGRNAGYASASSEIIKGETEKERDAASGTNETLFPSSMIFNNVSFKDFDALLLELSSTEIML
ncbi:hypothetical protein VNO77_25596 [Canavalia gladiata]|uniref:VQ domain-containing protein n=1 Tax=Canavalia gladiata TaxID=3824 RepID=A0AAN9LDK3_CANGL